jgi:hypothetical protein
MGLEKGIFLKWIAVRGKNVYNSENDRSTGDTGGQKRRRDCYVF